MIRNRMQNVSIVENVLKHLKLNTRHEGKEAFKLPSLLGNV